MNNFKRMLNILQTEIVLNEANLSSIIRKINKNDTAIAIISPFRKENTNEENEIYYEELKYEISLNGWGYLQLEGGWLENQGKHDEAMVKEKSVFIETEEDESLFNFCKKMARKYNQDAFLFKSNDKPFGAYTRTGKVDFLFKGEQEHKSGINKVFKNKEETSIKMNKINFSDIESMYSRLRFGNHSEIKFIFENISMRNASSACDAYKRKIWLQE